MGKVSKKIYVAGEPTRELVYYEINRYWKNNLRSPSIREIASVVHKSTCVVLNAIHGLRWQGLLVYSDAKARDITPTWIYDKLQYLLRGE